MEIVEKNKIKKGAQLSSGSDRVVYSYPNNRVVKLTDLQVGPSEYYIDQTAAEIFLTLVMEKKYYKYIAPAEAAVVEKGKIVGGIYPRKNELTTFDYDATVKKLKPLVNKYGLSDFQFFNFGLEENGEVVMVDYGSNVFSIREYRGYGGDMKKTDPVLEEWIERIPKRFKKYLDKAVGVW